MWFDIIVYTEEQKRGITQILDKKSIPYLIDQKSTKDRIIIGVEYNDFLKSIITL